MHSLLLLVEEARVSFGVNSSVHIPANREGDTLYKWRVPV